MTTQSHLTMDNSFYGQFHSSKGGSIEVNSPVVIFEQDNTTIVFCPTLEVYGYGMDESEAKSSFEVNLSEFFRYTLNKGTFDKELKRMGWEVKKRKRRYIQPSFSKMLRKNEKLIDIMDNNDIRTEHKQIAIPA